MHHILPPVCLVLALAMLVAAFAVRAVEPPDASIELHRARVEGDDNYRDVLEADLARRRLSRKFLIGSLFAGSGVMTVAAFATMRPRSSAA